ncbi:hypothetical protein BKA81DRAFT_51504 [Phyllosticta paracitricarpa]|uniref:Uncharacterized protein n=1 Tax=Phyllosticta citricarpa TaxID=55181 RepID=A0ABR1LRI1_9PEZI
MRDPWRQSDPDPYASLPRSLARATQKDVVCAPGTASHQPAGRRFLALWLWLGWAGQGRDKTTRKFLQKEAKIDNEKCSTWSRTPSSKSSSSRHFGLNFARPCRGECLKQHQHPREAGTLMSVSRDFRMRAITPRKRASSHSESRKPARKGPLPGQLSENNGEEQKIAAPRSAVPTNTNSLRANQPTNAQQAFIVRKNREEECEKGKKVE